MNNRVELFCDSYVHAKDHPRLRCRKRHDMVIYVPTFEHMVLQYGTGRSALSRRKVVGHCATDGGRFFTRQVPMYSMVDVESRDDTL